LLGERFFEEKPNLVQNLKKSYAVIDKDGSNDVDINELKEWLDSLINGNSKKSSVNGSKAFSQINDI